MAIKAIIFDADGVTVQGLQFSNQLEKEYGIPKEKTTKFFETDFPKCLIGNGDLKIELAKHVDEWGWKGSIDELLMYWFKTEHKLNEPLIEYITSLKGRGLKVFLATNNEKYRTEYMLNKMGFKDLFDKVYSSAHLGEKKPELEFFRKVLYDIPATEANEVVFWDDSSNNVEAAKEFGFKAEFYKDFEHCKETTEQYLLN